MPEMKTIGQMNTPYGEASINVGRYFPKGPIVVQLYGIEDGSPFATMSTRVPPVGLQSDEFCVKTWSENGEFVVPLMATGLFEATGREVTSGFVVAPVWRIKDPAMLP